MNSPLGPTTSQESLFERAKTYNSRILDGTIISNKNIYLAAKRFDKDLSDPTIYFDEPLSRRIDLFFKSLPLVGESSGLPFVLSDWQCWIIANIMCWKWVDDKTRRCKVAMVQIARGNGKTTLMAGLALFDLFDGNGKRIYGIANTEEQAAILLTTAQTMLRALKKYDNCMFASLITFKEKDSEMSTLPANERALDGLNPSLWIADEAAEFRGRFLTKLLTTGAKRKECTGIIISTPSDTGENIYGEMIENSTRILKGEIEDPTWFQALYGIDPEDDIADEGQWEKANPGLRFNQPTLRNLKRAWNTMKNSPIQRTEFCRYHCSRLSENTNNWLNMDLFDKMIFDYPEEKLLGRKCWMGLDLSKTMDMTALIIAFPLDDGRIYIKGYYWLPEVGLKERDTAYRAPVTTWAANGTLRTCPGNVVDYSMIEEEILLCMERYKVQVIAFDRWGAKDLARKLLDAGCPLKEYSMSISTFGPGCQIFQRYWVDKKLMFPSTDHIIRKAASETIAKRDEYGNIRPSKNRHTAIIDPVVAAIMAVHAYGGGQMENTYEKEIREMKEKNQQKQLEKTR